MVLSRQESPVVHGAVDKHFLISAESKNRPSTHIYTRGEAARMKSRSLQENGESSFSIDYAYIERRERVRGIVQKRNGI